jgi:hypothetical protein
MYNIRMKEQWKQQQFLKALLINLKTGGKQKKNLNA